MTDFMYSPSSQCLSWRNVLSANVYYFTPKTGQLQQYSNLIKNGKFGFGALKGNQIQTEREGLTYKIKDLEIKIMDGDKVFNRLKFTKTKPKVSDFLSFGLSRTMVSGRIISVGDAAPF